MNRADRRAAQRECRKYGHRVKVMAEGRWCVRCQQWVTEPETEAEA